MTRLWFKTAHLLIVGSFLKKRKVSLFKKKCQWFDLTLLLTLKSLYMKLFYSKTNNTHKIVGIALALSCSLSHIGLAQNANSNSNANNTNWLPNNGNVGIGTLNPAYKFHVAGNSAFFDVAKFNKGIEVAEDVLIGRDLKLPTLGNPNDGVLGTDANGKVISMSTENMIAKIYGSPINKCDALVVNDNSVMRWTSTYNKMILNPVGSCKKLGIGTDDPQEMVDIVGNTNIRGRLKIGDHSIILESLTSTTGPENHIYTSSTMTNNTLFIQSQKGTNNNTVINAYNFGNVGIGELNPQSKLHISGADNQAIEISSTTLPAWTRLMSVSSNGYPESQMQFKGRFTFVQDPTPSVSGVSRLVIDELGNVGIGESHPQSKLHVSGSDNQAIEISSTTRDSRLRLMAVTSNGYAEAQLQYNGRFTLVQQMSGVPRLTIDESGNTLINGNLTVTGTISGGSSQWQASGTKLYYNAGAVAIGGSYVPSGYIFAVNGKMITEEVNVKLRANWPDFVFDKNYDLMPLNDVETYIQKNNHLPGIQSDKEIEANGLSLGEMQRLQMQKIEEITLYLIEMKKENEALKKELDLLKSNK